LCRYGLDPFGKTWEDRTYQEFSRADYRFVPFNQEHALVRFYLRLDSHVYKDEVHTPYLLVEVLSLGGVITALTIFLGTIGRFSNGLMNDTEAVVASVEACKSFSCVETSEIISPFYPAFSHAPDIASVAWGDTESAAVFTAQLRKDQLPEIHHCRSKWWKVCL